MNTENLNQCHKAFESRTTPHLDLKRNEDGTYRYQAAQMAFRDFADGWQAASRSEIPGNEGEVERIARCLFVTKLPDILWPRICSWDETKYKDQFRKAAEAIIAEMEKGNE